MLKAYRVRILLEGYVDVVAEDRVEAEELVYLGQAQNVNNTTLTLLEVEADSTPIPASEWRADG